MEIKPGDMVKAAYIVDGHSGIYHHGVVVEIERIKDLFSEKYSITETNTYVRILSAGRVMTFEHREDIIELIDESR